jgi:hypothetical protein
MPEDMGTLEAVSEHEGLIVEDVVGRPLGNNHAKVKDDYARTRLDHQRLGS